MKSAYAAAAAAALKLSPKSAIHKSVHLDQAISLRPELTQCQTRRQTRETMLMNELSWAKTRKNFIISKKTRQPLSVGSDLEAHLDVRCEAIINLKGLAEAE